MQGKEDKKEQFKSIKRRMIVNFMLVIFISVVAFEALLIGFTRYYFYNNAEGILTNQIKLSADFYKRYFSNTSLQDNIIDNIDIFWKQTTAQVEIIDLNGKILMDSTGVIPDRNIDGFDFEAALKGGKGKWIGKSSYDGTRIMSISYPLMSNNNIVGVLRFKTSLEEIDKTINMINFIFLFIGLTVIIIGSIVSIFLSYSIIHPVKELKKAAEEMANGNLNIRVKEMRNDELGRLGKTFNYMADEIQKRETIKNEFISSVSHELRTPLTAIKGWAITLNSDGGSDKEILTDGLKIIENESERLTAMVEELLDFSKFISGRISLHKELVAIEDTIEYIEKYMKPRAERENINFCVKLKEGLPLVEVDLSRIKQVLINLLDNSFKFTCIGGNVSLEVLDQEKYIIFLVKDSGCGINKEDLPRVKDKFYKGKNSKAQNGLGLSICDEIISMHDGELIIESELGVGTTVLVKIPVAINNKIRR
ncbi:cell wall metabolism sensor histidine kinase WalK [Clostridium sp. BSD9I1]|uniref:sensor histidine kinase n=1 Tax=Clostridium sp. BSD9I1 TaxID=2003589 RepID=UPI0016496C2A|nr:ATP-binding protein [Clostridium sp. BSD9I1]